MLGAVRRYLKRGIYIVSMADINESSIYAKIAVKGMDCVQINMLGSESMTAAYLHALVKQSGSNVTTIHFREYRPRSTEPTEDELNTLTELVVSINPKLIMMSVQSLNYWDAITITRNIKKKTDVPILWGGVHPTVSPKECIRYADMICIGEAEKVIKPLLKCISSNRKYYDIHGLWVKKGKRIYHNPLPSLVKDLDKIPYPDYTNNRKIFLYNNKILYEDPSLAKEYVYALMTSRGCAFHCSYCFQSYLFNTYHGKYLRQRGVEDVMQELIDVKLNRPRLKAIYFWDNVFAMDRDWIERFAARYKKEINVPFFCYGHPLTLNEHRLKLLKEMGIKMLFVGIESGSQRIRKDIYHRHEQQQTIIEMDRLIHKYRINVGYDFITSRYDTDKDLDESFEMLSKFRKPFKINHNNLIFYQYYPITEKALSEKVITCKDIGGQDKSIRTQYQTEESISDNLKVSYFSLFGRRYISHRMIRFMNRHNFEKRYKTLFKKIPRIMERFDEFVHLTHNMITLMLSREFKVIYMELKRRSG